VKNKLNKFYFSLAFWRKIVYTLSGGENMSIKNPNWYELPKARWEERANDGERTWRDSQKAKLYDAENAFRRCNKDINREFDSIAEIERYANKWLRSAWVVRRWGKQPHITIVEITGDTATSIRGQDKISLPRAWAWNEVVVLHELCHIVHAYNGGTSHGRYYARCFLEAIGHRFGASSKKALRRGYILHGVKCTPRPVYSQEAKNKMRNQGREMAKKYFTNATCFNY
jgi:putative metallohydrolase (TIGR04338 family)